MDSIGGDNKILVAHRSIGQSQCATFAIDLKHLGVEPEIDRTAGTTLTRRQSFQSAVKIDSVIKIILESVLSF